jgi:hypothetical protein
MRRFILALMLVLPCGAAFAGGAEVGCDFHVLSEAQKQAQLEAANHQIPALLGPVANEMTPVPLDAVYIADPAIQRKVMAQQVYAHRTPAGSVEVLVRVVNCTDYPLQILGRTSFMDRTKFPTEDPSAWQLVYLNPRSFETYKEVSIGGAEVGAYLVEFRSNR